MSAALAMNCFELILCLLIGLKIIFHAQSGECCVCLQCSTKCVFSRFIDAVVCLCSIVVEPAVFEFVVVVAHNSDSAV